MSQIGVMLVFGAVLLLLLGAIRFFAWLTYLQETYGSLGGAIVAGVRYFVVVHSVKSPEDRPAIARNVDVVADVAPALQPIAEPQNEDNDLLSIVERAKVEALASLILESRHKAFQNGQVPETRGMHVLFGVSASSDPGSEYQRLRGMLRSEIARQSQPPATYRERTPEQQAARQWIEQDLEEALR